MAFETSVLVRFGDVDAAGIVFYPRYFEMLNSAIEDWCAQALGVDFRAMHLERDTGIPIVDLRATFVAPSILGDTLTVRITPRRIGVSSCIVQAAFFCNGEERFNVEMTLVCMRLSSRRSMPWPLDMRSGMEAGLGPQGV